MTKSFEAERGLHISVATQADLAEVAHVHVRAWQQAYVGLVPQAHLDGLDVGSRLQMWEKVFEQVRNDDLHGLFLARVAGSLAGFISFGPGRDEDRQEDAEIFAVYVLREYWHRGIGHRLYQTACDHFRNKGLLTAYLWVLDTNRNAIEAYTRWGGRLESGRQKSHVIDGQPVLETSVAFDVVE